MGVQESQNCTAITMWMKHQRMRWLVKDANSLAKALCRRENKNLVNTIGRYTDGLAPAMQMEQVPEALSAARASKNDGK